MMNQEYENAIRSVARNCRTEILKSISGIPISQHDRIITSILEKHTKEITALPPGKFTAKRWLSYYVRVVDKEIRA